VLESAGYAGLALLIALENVFPPIPSEIILPLSGFLVGQGRFNFVGALVASTAGSTVGAWVLYYLGRKTGERRTRAWVERHGKWILLSPEDLERALGWFQRHGAAAVFLGRFVPGIRSLISIPAGINRMGKVSFTAYTVAGSAIWNAVLIGLGAWLGHRWTEVGKYIDYIEKGLLVLLVLVMIRLVVRWIRRRKRGQVAA